MKALLSTQYVMQTQETVDTQEPANCWNETNLLTLGEATSLEELSVNSGWNSPNTENRLLAHGV